MKHKTLALFIVGIGILAIMVMFIGPGEVESALVLANPWYVALAVTIEFVIFIVWTQRWFITIKSLGMFAKRRHLLPMLLVGLAINNLTPSARGGGEPVRAYILGKYSNSPMENAFATVVADRGLDTFPFVILAIISILYMIFYFKLAEWIVYALIIALIILLITFFVILYMCVDEGAGEKITLWIVRVIKRFSHKEHSKLEDKALNAMRGFQDSIRVMIKDRNVLMYALPLSFVIWILEISRVYIVFLAFGAHIPIGVIAAVFVIATLIGMIPLLPGGLGAVDGVMILMYSVAGIPPFVSAAVTIVERLISFWMPSILGMLSLPYFGTGVMEEFSDEF
jgi:hypothetical protein